jgi:hypothetical protein
VAALQLIEFREDCWAGALMHSRSSFAGGQAMQQSAAKTQEDERAALYVAGQAVIALTEGLTVVGASIAGDGNAPYWIDVTEPELPETGALGGRHRKTAESIVRALLAGIAADGRSSTLDLTDPEFLGEDAVIRAAALMRRITSKPARVLPRIWREVADAVSEPRTSAAITAVAELLLQETTVSGRTIACVMDRAMSSNEFRVLRSRA